MAEIKRFPSPKEFLEHNEKTLGLKYFEHYHLHHLFGNVRKGNEKLNDGYNIIDEDGTNVMVVYAEEIIFIYADKWNEVILELLQKEISQAADKTFLIRGQKQIILQLLEKLKFEYEIKNDRIIYECESVNPLMKQEKGKFGITDFDDMATILKMSVDYYVEEFEGKGQQSHESVKASGYQGVKDSSIFKWTHNGRIVSMARKMGDNSMKPFIGGLFTKVNERNKGYAYFLLSKLTSHLLSRGADKCGLLTEATKIATNKIFEKVGYKKVYEWINILKK
jgi:predicted GNAT family acetyltransferase